MAKDISFPTSRNAATTFVSTAKFADVHRTVRELAESISITKIDRLYATSEAVGFTSFPFESQLAFRPKPVVRRKGIELWDWTAAVQLYLPNDVLLDFDAMADETMAFIEQKKHLLWWPSLITHEDLRSMFALHHVLTVHQLIDGSPFDIARTDYTNTWATTSWPSKLGGGDYVVQELLDVRQRLVMQAVVGYAKSNLGDINEAYEDEDNPDNIRVRGERGPAIQETELDVLLRQFTGASLTY